MADVSVFVPCHDYGHYLRECVGSVLSQEDVDVEVLVIDDASSDDSAVVAHALSAGDPRVSVRVHETNRGHIATYNEGLEWASARYLLLLSADDMLVPGALARAVTVLDEHPSVGFVFGDVPRPGEEGRPLRTVGDARVYRGHDWLEERCRTGYNVVPVPTAVVRTSLQRQVGGYLSDHPHAGDLEMWLRLAAYGDVAELPTHQGVYRRHAASMSQAHYAEAGIADLQACLRAFDETLTTHRAAIPDADRLQRLAHRACARRMVGRVSTLYETGARRPEHVDALLAMALQADPDVRRSDTYLKLRIRQVLGVRGSAHLARLKGGSGGATSQVPVETPLPQAGSSSEGDRCPGVTAVVVTYNRYDVLSDTLAAVSRQTRPPARIVVVDNASTDGTAAALQEARPDVLVLALPENEGFGAGLAAGMQRAVELGADYCWLLDDDSRPDPGALAAALAAAERFPGAGLVGFSGGRLRLGVPERGTVPGSPLATVADGVQVHRRDWALVDGALVPRRTVLDAGYPRSDFFMMMEDIEYTGRIRRSGADVLVLQPDLISRAHLGSTGASQPAVPWREYYQTRNHLLVARQHGSWPELAGWALRQARFVMADASSSEGRSRIRFRLRGAADGARGRSGRTLDPATGRRSAGHGDA